MYGVLVQLDFCYTLRKEIEKGNLFLRKPFAHGLKPLLYIPMEKKKEKCLTIKIPQVLTGTDGSFLRTQRNATKYTSQGLC